MIRCAARVAVLVFTFCFCISPLWAISPFQPLLEEARTNLHKTPWRSISPADRALELAMEAGDAHVEGQARLLLGNVYLDMNRLDQALEHLLPARDIFRRMGDRTLEAETLQRLGALYQLQKRGEQALSHYNQSLQIFTDLDDKKGVARVYNSLGVYHWYAADYEQSLTFYRQAETVQLGLDDPVGLSATLNNIGMIESELGNHKSALTYYKRSLEIKRPINYYRGIAATLGNMGDTYLELGQLNSAADTLKESIQIAELNEHTDLLVSSLKTLGQVRAKQRRFQEALELMNQWGQVHEGMMENRAHESMEAVQALHELEQKNKAIQLLEQKNQIAELTIARQETRQSLMLVGLGVLVVVICGILCWFRYRVQKNRVIRQQYQNLQDAMERISVLKGLLPICASCKKIRDDKGYWVQVEEYMSDHSDATFSHGICPPCAKELYGDLATGSQDES